MMTPSQMLAIELAKPSKFTRAQIDAALKYCDGLTAEDHLMFWRHYTTGTGARVYANVRPNESFNDYLVLSVMQSEAERSMDC